MRAATPSRAGSSRSIVGARGANAEQKGCAVMVRCAIISAVGVVALALGAAAAAEPVSDAFTYQGRLESSGSPAQGLHDLRFTLYDAPTGGASVGPTLSFNVLIQNGLFTLPLNFGPDAFDGERRFLEIEARATNPLDPNPFETLTPRQEVSPAPHAGFSIATRGMKQPMPRCSRSTATRTATT